MQGIVDRIEGKYLIVELEDGQMIEISKSCLKEAKEGDVLSINDDEIRIDKEESKKRSKKIKDMFEDLLE